MNDTKSIFASKTVWGILFALFAPWLNKKFGIVLDDAAQQAIIEQVMVAAGSILAIYGRITAKHDLTVPVVKPPAGPSIIAILCGALAFGTGCQSLQDKWDALSPNTQAAAKAAAKLALSFGLSELGQSVKEVRPWQDKLQGVINTTFAKASDPEAIGAVLAANVKASVPPDVQPMVLAKFKDSLTNPKITASAVGGDAFNAKIASKL